MLLLSSIITLFLLICSSVRFGNASTSSKCFRASVVEHILIGENELLDDQDPLKNVRKNLLAYDEAAERAAGEHADIVVFPEEGLYAPTFSSNPNLTLRQVMRLLAEDIPDPRQGPVNPCSSPGRREFEDRPILQTLSCIARRSQIYLVANMADIKHCPKENCTSDGVLIYNSQVAFDRQGNLIARYHKYHLFGEYHSNVPDQQELVYFDTDFGARIGLYICFDRLFQGPIIPLVEQYNVTTMALSTWFFDEYPFLMSHQIDQSWSQALGINILSSNAKNLTTGTTGSGIFTPNYVAGYTHDTTTGGKTIHSMQIVGNVPVDPKSGAKCDPDPWIVKQSKYLLKNGGNYQAFHADFNKLVTRELSEPEARGETICDGDLCCSVDYKIKPQKKSSKQKPRKTFYLGAKNRLRDFYYQCNYQLYEQACFILAYNNETGGYENETTTVFEELNISGNFSTDYLYPGALGNDYKLIKTKNIHAQGNELSVFSRKPLIYAGIYGRVYDRDPPYVQEDCGEIQIGSNTVNG